MTDAVDFPPQFTRMCEWYAALPKAAVVDFRKSELWRFFMQKIGEPCEYLFPKWPIGDGRGYVRMIFHLAHLTDVHPKIIYDQIYDQMVQTFGDETTDSLFEPVLVRLNEKL